MVEFKIGRKYDNVISNISLEIIERASDKIVAINTATKERINGFVKDITTADLPTSFRLDSSAEIAEFPGVGRIYADVTARSV